MLSPVTVQTRYQDDKLIAVSAAFLGKSRLIAAGTELTPTLVRMFSTLAADQGRQLLLMPLDRDAGTGDYFRVDYQGEARNG